ncbi:hypothetical protein [Streptomyces sp. TE5632]
MEPGGAEAGPHGRFEVEVAVPPRGKAGLEHLAELSRVRRDPLPQAQCTPASVNRRDRGPPHAFDESAETIAAVVSKPLAKGYGEVEVSRQALGDRVEPLLRDGVPFGSPACIPGHYNNEGAAVREDLRAERRRPAGCHRVLRDDRRVAAGRRVPGAGAAPVRRLNAPPSNGTACSPCRSTGPPR